MDSTTAPAVPSERVFTVKPYQPDGGYDFTGVNLALFVMMIAGILAGIGAHYVSRLFWLILLFPTFIGFFLGTLKCRFIVRYWNRRRPNTALEWLRWTRHRGTPVK